MEKGRYKGFYQFNDEKYGRLRGFDKTYFIIEIDDSDGREFKGWVEDDISTGGMEGRGTIIGEVNKNGISFLKSMPYRGFLIPNKATGEHELRIDKTKKHMPILYKGFESESGYYKGEWIIKFGILLQFTLLLIGLLGRTTRGTWEMSKINE